MDYDKNVDLPDVEGPKENLLGTIQGLNAHLEAIDLATEAAHAYYKLHEPQADIDTDFHVGSHHMDKLRVRRAEVNDRLIRALERASEEIDPTEVSRVLNGLNLGSPVILPANQEWTLTLKVEGSNGKLVRAAVIQQEESKGKDKSPIEAVIRQKKTVRQVSKATSGSMFTKPALAFLEAQGASVFVQARKSILGVASLGGDHSPLLSYFLREEDEEFQRRHQQTKRRYNCATQQEGIHAMVVGGFDADQKIHIWKNNTVLRWYIVEKGFSQSDFTVAENGMLTASAAWNRVAPGNVRFERATSYDAAHFHVIYTPGRRTSDGYYEAESFVPADYNRGKSVLKIYQTGLTFSRNQLANVLCHELGHALGFRHSFALLKERMWQAGLYGRADSHSVMSYEHPQHIDLLDVQSSRKVYQEFQDAEKLNLSDGFGRMIQFTVVRVNA